MKAEAHRPYPLWVWGLLVLALMAAPHLWTSPFAHSVLCQIGIAAIACWSFNLLWGEGGMLSFGHAVYTGLGAFFAIHLLNAVQAAAAGEPLQGRQDPSVLWWLPFVPLLSGALTAGVAAVLGWISTQRAGTSFAMITLGLGELVHALALMAPSFLGGEGGITGNRVASHPLDMLGLAITFGPRIELYDLIALYTLSSAALMVAFTQTPLGLLLNAVRDNPDRVKHLGYDPRGIRYPTLVIAGFFAGISGGLAAMNFEIVTPEVFAGQRSLEYLFFTFLGGASFLFGPLLGAVLLVLTHVLLPQVTQAWPLYLGFLFMLMVMYAPQGLWGLRLDRAWRQGFRRPSSLWRWIMGVVMALAGAALIEMLYDRQRRSSGAADEASVRFFGLVLNTQDTQAAHVWGVVVGVLLTAGALFALAMRDEDGDTDG